MLIPHPLLGLRDASEFTYFGDAALLQRPSGVDVSRSFEQIAAAFYDYLFLRDNPAGVHRELWYHEHGDRSWLVVTRNTVTHQILDVQLASEVARALKSGPAKTKEPS